jgi:hypothetical protein
LPALTEDSLYSAFLEAVAQLQREGDALLGEKEELQRFGDEVHAIAAETGIASHPKIPFGRVLEIAAGRGNARAAALASKASLRTSNFYPRAPK